jgi:thiamine-monophosphate kinase
MSTIAVQETTFVDRLIARFPRTSAQVNVPHESDAELVRLDDGSFLAATTDAISEEISTGLYDAYTAGWVLVMANLSDLAAVGADPIGLLVNETLPRDCSAWKLTALQSGIAAACSAVRVAILGGDTNMADTLQVSATALGIVRGTPISRRGTQVGDILFGTRRMGHGNAFAAAKLLGATCDPFRPVARITEGRLIRAHATACMDTSDAAIATIDQLARVNSVGFALEPLTDIIHPSALAIAARTGAAPWMMLAAPHGEFELLFTLPPNRVPHFTPAARDAGWEPVRIGVATDAGELRLHATDGAPVIDGAAVRNVADAFTGSVERAMMLLTNCVTAC